MQQEEASRRTLEDTCMRTGFLLAPSTRSAASTSSAALKMISATALGGASSVSSERCIWCCAPLAFRIGTTLRTQGHALQLVRPA